MTDQPPQQPLDQPSGSLAEGQPATLPRQAAASGSPAGPPVPATSNLMHQATLTHNGRWAIGIVAVALACLMLLGVGVAGLFVLRSHNVFGMMGQQQNRSSRNQFGQGNGGNGSNPAQPGVPRAPGMRGGRAMGGLGSLLGSSALHGNVTATVNGSPQALVFQRGLVTAISATSISLQSSDGFTGTYGRTAQTSVRTEVPVTGGQALVLARASDKVAITIMSTQANTGVGPTS
jgi:hypothetical protein